MGQANLSFWVVLTFVREHGEIAIDSRRVCRLVHTDNIHFIVVYLDFCFLSKYGFIFCCCKYDAISIVPSQVSSTFRWHLYICPGFSALFIPKPLGALESGSTSRSVGLRSFCLVASTAQFTILRSFQAYNQLSPHQRQYFYLARPRHHISDGSISFQVVIFGIQKDWDVFTPNLLIDHVFEFVHRRCCIVLF